MTENEESHTQGGGGRFGGELESFGGDDGEGGEASKSRAIQSSRKV